MGSERLVQLTLSIDRELKVQLENLARAHGFLWGADKPNVSALIRAIGDGQLTVAPREFPKRTKKKEKPDDND